ncbi:MAG: phytoene/squalene synthase family protein [Candidatus Saccharimonadaceae bacterium]
MDLYTKTSYELSRILTFRYSTSFSSSTKLFAVHIQPHIFAIYGLVRIGDEIVDTYTGKDGRKQLDMLEKETYTAIKTGYSTNPIVHAFAQTAQKYNITKKLIAPFFESMRMDLTPKKYTQNLYEKYIYGSAEVIGLMCLKVFVEGDKKRYEELAPGAKALGAAYQKVNFLRDIASDYIERQRMYFPNTSFQTFDETAKQVIIVDITKDFHEARQALEHLPKSAQKAVKLSYTYYNELQKKLKSTPAETLKQRRIRVSTPKKIYLRIVQPPLKKKALK